MAKADMSRSARRPRVVVTAATGRKPQSGGEVQTAHVPCATPAVSVSLTAIAVKQTEHLLMRSRLRQAHTKNGRQQGAYRQLEFAAEVPWARITAGLRPPSTFQQGKAAPPELTPHRDVRLADLSAFRIARHCLFPRGRESSGRLKNFA